MKSTLARSTGTTFLILARNSNEIRDSFYKNSASGLSLSINHNQNRTHSFFSKKLFWIAINNMNGDTYSSRGMAPSTTKPKREDGATTDKKASTDRHGSSRDYHVRMFHQLFQGQFI